MVSGAGKLERGNEGGGSDRIWWEGGSGGCCVGSDGSISTVIVKVNLIFSRQQLTIFVVGMKHPII